MDSDQRTQYQVAWAALAAIATAFEAALMVTLITAYVPPAPIIVSGAVMVVSLYFVFAVAMRTWPFRKPPKDDPPAVDTSTSTFRGGALGGNAQLSVRSTADYLTHGTDIADDVRLDAEHHPGLSGRDVDSADGQVAPESPGTTPEGEAKA